MEGNGDKFQQGEFQGMTKAQIETLFYEIAEIKKNQQTMSNKLESIDMWKAKVMGISSGFGILGGLVVKYIWK